jgi:putative transposase
LTGEERQAIENFARQHPLEGYRRMSYMMLDADIVACSPSTVYRQLLRSGLLAGQTPQPTKKGTGFEQPLAPHGHWHIDICYLNIAGTFYFQCSILDGFSRFVVHHEIREKMAETDTETILQRAREKFPGTHPRIISDNGPQFIARDFKEFIRIAGMTHVRTSPYYPQSNGKIERWHRTLKSESIRPSVPLSIEEARRIVGNYVDHYNTVRLNSAIGYVTPRDMLDGRQQEIFDSRNRKLADARLARAQRRAQARNNSEAQRPPDKPLPQKTLIDFTILRAQLSIADVLEKLGFRPQSSRGSQLRGPCPLHGATGGTARCFSADTSRNLFHCFKCGRGGNALDLWAQAQKLTIHDAAIDLCERLNIPLPSRPVPGGIREEEPVTHSLDNTKSSDKINQTGATNYSTQQSRSSISG